MYLFNYVSRSEYNRPFIQESVVWYILCDYIYIYMIQQELGAESNDSEWLALSSRNYSQNLTHIHPQTFSIRNMQICAGK